MSIAVVLTIFAFIHGSLQCTDSDFQKRRYQLSFRLNGVHTCSGAVVNRIKGVTLAHCGGGALSSYSVLGGSGDKDPDMATCTDCQVRPLTAFNVNPYFVNSAASGYPNDIAVMHFNDLGTTVMPILLASPISGDFEGINCLLSGWGLDEFGNSHNNLKETQVNMLSTTLCVYAWNDFQNEKLRISHICAGYSSPCTPDAGALLVCGSTLVGLASWGERGYPLVHSRIGYFRTFIDNN